MLLLTVILLAWLLIHALALLPRKLSAAANVLLYIVLSIIDINKLALLSFRYRVYEIDERVSHFLAVMLYRDTVFTLALLLFANVAATDRTAGGRLAAAAACFAFLLGTGMLLRAEGAIQDRNWNLGYESLTIAILIGIAYAAARALPMATGKDDRYA